MLKLAEAHRRRALTAASRPDDITEAVRLADAAHRQRQRWGGPVAAALAELLRALFVRGDYTEVLRRALPEPAGIAGAKEAADSAVLALACQAAKVTGQDPLATRLVAQMPESARRAQLELYLIEEGDPEFAVRLEAILDRAVEEDDAETIVRAVFRLSEHGVDRTDEAQRLHELGIVPDQYVRLPRAILLARHDLDAALPDLRALAADDPVAAETLVRLLASHGRHDEALDELAALPEALRVSEHDLRVLVLLEAGRGSDAENAAVDALSDGTLSSTDRRRLHRLLATRAAQRDDPHALIRWCRRAIGTDANASAADPVVVWWLIAAQLNVGRLDDARLTYQHYQPEVRTRDQVQTWAALHRAGGWDRVILKQGLELAQTWADDVDVSAGLLIIMVMGTGREGSPDEAVDPNDVRRRLWLEVERHCERYGDSSPIHQVAFDPEKPDEFFNRLRDSLLVRSEVLGKLTRAVQLLQAPLGLLAEAAGHPYALAVVQRAAGLTPACAPAQAEYDLELNSAQKFISVGRGARAVTDAPALNLTGLLNVAEVIRGAGIRLVLPRASRLRHPDQPHRGHATAGVTGIAALGCVLRRARAARGVSGPRPVIWLFGRGRAVQSGCRGGRVEPEVTCSTRRSAAGIDRRGEAGSGAAHWCRCRLGRLWLRSARCCRAHVRGGSWRCGWGCGVRGRWVWTRVVVVGVASEGGGGVPGVGGGQWGRCRPRRSGPEMASKVSSRQQAMAKARECRSALDQDRVARDRRVEEATAQVLLQLQERAAAEQAVQVANAEIGAVLRRLLQDEGIAAEGVGALVDLTVGEVRLLTRAVPAAVGEGQVHATGAAAGGTGAGGPLAAVPSLEGCK